MWGGKGIEGDELRQLVPRTQIKVARERTYDHSWAWFTDSRCIHLNGSCSMTWRSVASHLLCVGGLLGQETQLLPPVLAHLGDDGVEQAELLALLVHLVVGVLEHHLEAVVAKAAWYNLRVGG